jgi:hypothetical protein
MYGFSAEAAWIANGERARKSGKVEEVEEVEK